MEEELCRLRSQVELQRMQTTVIATLEGERAALERDRDALRSTADALRSAQRKVSNSYSNTQRGTDKSVKNKELLYKQPKEKEELV